MLRKLVARLAGHGGPAGAGAETPARGSVRSPGDDLDVRICRVDDAEFFAGELFRRVFGDPLPEAPVHYVAFARSGSDDFAVAGYYHVAYCGEYALVGGLCVDDRFRNRGIGERLERFVYQDAGETKAYFAHVGDATRARRVGFADTAYPHLVACWMRDVSIEEKDRITAEVAALGPF